MFNYRNPIVIASCEMIIEKMSFCILGSATNFLFDIDIQFSVIGLSRKTEITFSYYSLSFTTT